jgi:hypothetical protein
MKDEKFVKLFDLAIDYVQHNINEGTAPDPEEWKWEQREKFDRLYDEVERLLGFPSFAESQQELMKEGVDFEAHMKESSSRHAITAQLASKIMALVTKSAIQLSDLPIDKKAQLLAANDTVFEDELLAAELKCAQLLHEDLKRAKAQGLF